MFSSLNHIDTHTLTALAVRAAYVACEGLEQSPCVMACEAKVLRGYWQGFFRGQAMAHNVGGLGVSFGY
jgi:purine nucleoside permease